MTRAIPVSQLERVLAAYVAMIGLVFTLDPASFTSPLYAAWHAFGIQQWGAVLLFIALLHFAAAWVNGNAPRVSLPFRAFACLCHMAVSLQFGIFFLQAGALFAVPLFFWFVPAMIFIILGPVIAALQECISHARIRD